MLVNPAEEEEFEVERGEGLAYHVHCGDGEGVVESVLAALVGGFFDEDACFGDGVVAAGHDFGGFLGVVGGDGTQLGDVEDLQGAASKGGAGVDGGAVREFRRRVGEGCCLHFFLNHAADGSDEAVFFGGGVREVVEVVEGEAHFFHFLFCLRAGAVDDAAGDVGGEERSVQLQDGDEGGDAQLAHLEDVVSVVEVVVEFFLRPVHCKARDLAVLVHDPVEVVKPPLALGEKEGDFLVLFRRQIHGSTIYNVQFLEVCRAMPGRRRKGEVQGTIYNVQFEEGCGSLDG